MRVKADEEVTVLTDLEMMQESAAWPAFPLLPLKRYQNKPSDPELGILWQGCGPTVYRCSMFYLPKTPEESAALLTIKYESFEALVNDGWVID